MYGVKQLPFSYQVIWETKEKEGKLRKAQSKMQTKNTITKIKNTLEEANSRISEAERIHELEGKMVEITSEEQNKVKRMKRTEDIVSETSGTIQNAPTFEL